MSRKITTEACKAFMNSQRYNNTNTSVTPPDSEGWTYMLAYGSKIARHRDGLYQLSDGGYRSMTTKERLNGVCSAVGQGSVAQVKGEWYYSSRDATGQRQMLMPRNEWVTIKEQSPMQILHSGLRDLTTNP